ncbi:hypothetical protein [Stappia sp.]|uniref:hypothetical protein n=1 Tax=Stappia sp. TaxID=1870903 RepID=UPI003A99E8E4
MAAQDATLDGHDAGTGLTWRYRPGRGSDTLVVVQSQARVPQGRFGLERLFAKTRHACLFLNGPDESWYLGCEAASDAAIDAAIVAARPGRIIHYGASKGAYGALLTALRRGDGPAFAFGPELELGVPGSQSALSRVRGQQGEPDLAGALLAPTTPHPLTLVFGLHDPVDAAGFARLAAQPRPEHLRLLALRSPHASHDHLYTLNIIRKLIVRFDRDLGGLCAERGLIAPEAAHGLASAFGVAGERFADGDGLSGAALAEELDTTGNPGHALLAAQAFLREGSPNAALALLETAIALNEADPSLAAQPKRWRKTFWHQALAAARAGGDAPRAAAIAARARARFPEDAGFCDAP